MYLQIHEHAYLCSQIHKIVPVSWSRAVCFNRQESVSWLSEQILIFLDYMNTS